MTSSVAPAAQWLNAAGQPVQLGEELGRGGQGAVYRLPQHPQQVAKVYLEAVPAMQVQKLQALVASRTPELEAISAWPGELLYTPGGQPRGFVMPLLDLQEYRELHLLYSPASRRKHFPRADWGFLVHVRATWPVRLPRCTVPVT